MSDATTVMSIDVRTYRQPACAIEELFVQRWSPRAMSEETMSAAELLTLFEATR